MIPPKIHYIWFGGRPLPEGMKLLVDGWRNLMPDHEVVQWDESNFDLAMHPWLQHMHETRQYAFASDYARLVILREHGGIYMDTDMQMKKSLSPFTGSDCLLSFEFDHFISTAIIGAAPRHPLIEGLLAEYDHIGDRPLDVNNVLVTEYLIRHFPEFRLNNREQMLDGGIRIMPKEYLILPSFNPDKNYARHLANNQWKKTPRRPGLGKIARAVVGEVLFYKLYNLQMGWRSDLPAKERARRKATGG